MLGAIFRQFGIDAIEGVNPRAEAMRIFITNAGLLARE